VNRYLTFSDIARLMQLIVELQCSNTPNLLPYSDIIELCKEVLEWREKSRR
jgi:hypothetical protein